MSNHSSDDDRLPNNEPNGSISMELPLVLRVEDLTQILSIGRNTAYELVRSGKIKSFRIGRSYRITRDAIAEYLAQSQDSR
jgi:excisionase family DNA binding protein